MQSSTPLFYFVIQHFLKFGASPALPGVFKKQSTCVLMQLPQVTFCDVLPWWQCWDGLG